METIAPLTIRLGHSPDSDDAFMFWGLASGEVKSRYQFEHILKDIQTLNEWAMEGRLESTAVSVHAFSHVADKYALLRHGGSFGDGYGPMIVAKEAFDPKELAEKTIAIPGLLTSAYLAYRLYFAELLGAGAEPKFKVVPFDEIIPTVLRGEVDCGLIIHEGQLTYAREGLALIADMGKWWKDQTGLPLPLGVNVVRKDLGEDVVQDVSRVMRESVQAGLANRKQALGHALKYARGMDEETSDEFVGMYVNDRTLDMGEEGVRSIRLFLERAAAMGLCPKVQVDVVD